MQASDTPPPLGTGLGAATPSVPAFSAPPATVAATPSVQPSGETEPQTPPVLPVRPDATLQDVVDHLASDHPLHGYLSSLPPLPANTSVTRLIVTLIEGGFGAQQTLLKDVLPENQWFAYEIRNNLPAMRGNEFLQDGLATLYYTRSLNSGAILPRKR